VSTFNVVTTTRGEQAVHCKSIIASVDSDVSKADRFRICSPNFCPLPMKLLREYARAWRFVEEANKSTSVQGMMSILFETEFKTRKIGF
jgi:hypothetical protein